MKAILILSLILISAKCYSQVKHDHREFGNPHYEYIHFFVEENEGKLSISLTIEKIFGKRSGFFYLEVLDPESFNGYREIKKYPMIDTHIQNDIIQIDLAMYKTHFFAIKFESKSQHRSNAYLSYLVK